MFEIVEREEIEVVQGEEREAKSCNNNMTGITEISSAHGYKNSTSSNSDEVIHGPKLIPQHSKKVKKLYKVVKN